MLLLCKVFNVWPKNYRGVIFHGTEGWCKIWRITDLWFGKWHEEYEKFSPEHLKVSKVGLLWDSLFQSIKIMSLKFTEELSIMIMKNDAKFKRNWLVILKLARHFMNFDPSILYLKVSKLFILMCSFWAMYLLFELKKVRRSYLSWHWRGIQNLERNRLVFSKLTWGIWQILTWALESFKNFHVNGLLLS